MASAVLDGSTKRNSLCNPRSCSETPIIPVSCACCQRVLVKEEGVPRVLTGPAKKIKLEFDPEPFIKKETPDPCSPAPKPTQQENENGMKRRGGERIVFKEENVDGGNKSVKGSTPSLPSSDISFNFAKPKANFGQYKRPFQNNYRGDSWYNQPPYYRNNNYRNNSNTNSYARNHIHYHNNGHFGAFRGGFTKAPALVTPQILNQHLNGGSITTRSPLAIKQSFSSFNAHVKTPPCSPLPPKPSIQYHPSSPSLKRNVTSTVIPDPPREPNPAASQTGQGWWKSSEWSKKSSDSSAANLSNNGSVKLNVLSPSVPVSEIPSPSNADKPKTKTFIGQDHGLHTQRASCNSAGGTIARKRLTADIALDDDLCNGEDDQAFANNVVDDKDWIEELALEPVIPVKALCSSCLHSSEPKPEDDDSANADIEILFNSCDIQICSEEGSSISKKGSGRKRNIFKQSVEVVDINDFNDDLEDITPEIHKTITKRKLFVKKPCIDVSNTKNIYDNTNIVDLLGDEDENNEKIEEIGRSGENDPHLVRHNDHLLEVFDIGEDIVLDEVCGNGEEEGGSCRPRRMNELSEEEQEQTDDLDDQGAGNGTKEAGQMAAAVEGVEPALVVKAGDINMEVGVVGEELTVLSESSTGADTLVDHSADISQSENRPVEAAVVNNEAWDEVLREMQEVGEEVEELIVLDTDKDLSAQQRFEEEHGRSKQDSEARDQCNGDQEIEVCDLESGVTHKKDNKCESPGCAEEIQVVGDVSTALDVPNEVVKSGVVSLVSDDCEEVTSVEKVENNSDDPSLASCRKMVTAKTSGLGQPRTLKKFTRLTGSSTPLRLTRSLRPSSLLPDSNTSTDDDPIVDESTQLATSSLPSHHASASQSGILSGKSVATPSRRSRRLTKNELNVSVAAAITTVDDDKAQSDQLIFGSTHENLLVEVDIASSAAIKTKLPVLTRAMLKQISHKPCKDLPIIVENSRSTLDGEGGVGRVTRRSVAASPAAVARRVDYSRRNNALAGNGATPANHNAIAGNGAALANESSDVAHRSRVMTTGAALVGSVVLVSLKSPQLAGSNQAVPSKDGNSDNGEDRGDGLDSEYDLDYEEDLVAPEVTNKEEERVQKSCKAVPAEEDDDDVTCLD